MGLLDLLRRLGILRGGRRPRRRSPPIPPDVGHDTIELARRLGLPLSQVQATELAYQEFTIPKRSGGRRTIAAPQPALKGLQRRILRRLFSRLKSHPCATGFERGRSIVTNAAAHVRADVVVKMDLEDFFGSTEADRVRDYLRAIGWNADAADLLVRLCTHAGSLPQGAPTSPRLSNLVNYEMDARLAGLAGKLGGAYTRYADDITFSFRGADVSAASPTAARNPKTLQLGPPRGGVEGLLHACTASAIGLTKCIVADYGYRLHKKRKLHVRRRHQCQLVTGLVVNQQVALPRRTRRWLRAVAHRLQAGRDASLTPAQLAGWDALASMIETQAPR